MPLAVAASVASADPAADLAKARADLVGHSSRQWVKERVVVSMGGSKACSSGETYNFRSDGTVEIALCVDHVLTKRSVAWTLQPAPPLDITLRFDGRSYLLSFAGTKGVPQMRWRKLGQAKPNPTVDILLGLSRD